MCHLLEIAFKAFLCRNTVNSHSQGIINNNTETQAWKRSELLSISLGLDGEGLVEEFLVEMLLDVVHENDGFALVVELRAAGAPHHLQHVWNTTFRNA